MLDNQLPMVSVIITTYKRSDMLSRAITSVLNQNYKNIEVVIVDDNDPNSNYRANTENTMLQFKSISNIKYCKHSKNMNGAAARNTGLKNARGNFVCFLDDDDTYRSEKVREQVEFLVNNKEYHAVYCGWNRDEKAVIPVKDGNLTFEILSGTSIIYTNVIMMRTDIALNIGGWDERFRRNQEAAFLLRYFKHGYKIGVVSKVLVDFDTSDRSNSSNPVQNEQDFDTFLLIHDEQINICSSKFNESKKVIYSYRYRGVLLNYLKNGDLRGAFKLYIKMIKKIPVRYNLDIIVYVLKRLQKKDVFL